MERYSQSFVSISISAMYTSVKGKGKKDIFLSKWNIQWLRLSYQESVNRTQSSILANPAPYTVPSNFFYSSFPCIFNIPVSFHFPFFVLFWFFLRFFLRRHHQRFQFFPPYQSAFFSSSSSSPVYAARHGD